MANNRALVLLSADNKTVQRQIDGDTLIVGAGITTASGNTNIGSASSVRITAPFLMAAGISMSAEAGAGSVDWSNMTGTFKTPSGALQIAAGGTGTATFAGQGAFTKAGTGLAVTNDATVGGALTVTGQINANGGVQRTSAGTLNIGTDANTTKVQIGSVGVLTEVLGDFKVDGAETIVGNSTYQGNETFQGNVTFGDASTDQISFVGQVTSDIVYATGSTRQLYIAQPTTAGTAGSQLNVLGAKGANASGATAGSTGGLVLHQAGAGGDGTVAAAAGPGGELRLKSGDAGANNGAGGASSGAVTIDAGTPTGTGAGGTITIGGTNAAGVVVGRSSGTLTFNGAFTQQNGAFSFTGSNVASSSISSGTQGLTISAGAGSSWGTTGGLLSLTGSSGLNLQVAGTTVAALTGASFTIQAGVTLQTTSTGNINLPNNANAKFQIEGTGVSANVTATNLGTLTAGSTSDAAALHTHNSGIGAAQNVDLDSTGMVFVGLSSGLFAYASAANQYSATDNAAMSTSLCVGEYTGSTIRTAGIVAAAKCTTAGGAPTVGGRLFLAAASDDALTGAGKLTATAPSAVGSVRADVGICIDATNYAGAKTVKMIIRMLEPIQL